MINIDLGPVSGVFTLVGTHSWENGKQSAGYNLAMHWTAETPMPAVGLITWVDKIPEEEKQKAESEIRQYFEDNPRSFSILYH